MHTSDITRGLLVRIPWDLPDYGQDPRRFSIADGVRASMSIPFFFEPVRQTSTACTVEVPQSDGTTVKRQFDGGQVTWVDGGMLSNFPISVFDRTDNKPARWPTVGIKLSAAPLITIADVPVKNTAQEAMRCMHTMMNEWDRYRVDTGADRIIFIDNGGIKATQFDLTPAQQQDLFRAGAAAALNFVIQESGDGGALDPRPARRRPTYSPLGSASGGAGGGPASAAGAGGAPAGVSGPTGDRLTRGPLQPGTHRVSGWADPLVWDQFASVDRALRGGGVAPGQESLPGQGRVGDRAAGRRYQGAAVYRRCVNSHPSIIGVGEHVLPVFDRKLVPEGVERILVGGSLRRGRLAIGVGGVAVRIGSARIAGGREILHPALVVRIRGDGVLHGLGEGGHQLAALRQTAGGHPRQLRHYALTDGDRLV